MKPQLGSLLSINQLTTEQIEAILRLARRMNPDRPSKLLHGKRVVLLFYESSTRTRTSFEFAAKALGAVTTLVTATSSSIEKGESLIDTGWTVRVHRRRRDRDAPPQQRLGAPDVALHGRAHRQRRRRHASASLAGTAGRDDHAESQEDSCAACAW